MPSIASQFEGILVCDIFFSMWRLSWLRSRVFCLFLCSTSPYEFPCVWKFAFFLDGFKFHVSLCLTFFSSMTRAHDPFLYVNLNCFMFDDRIKFVFLSA